MTHMFTINSSSEISKEFLKRNISTFEEAARFVKDMPYGRNPNKNNLISLFEDGCGTCSTKHALLKGLADENGFEKLRLMVGIFKMNGTNTPPVSDTLKQHGLDYIPEAHCYLRYDEAVIDCTSPHSGPDDFLSDLLEEIEITPDQITDFKVDYHKQYLAKWLDSANHLTFTLDEIWRIREQCIKDLSNAN